jgi:hypothetical protein
MLHPSGSAVLNVTISVSSLEYIADNRAERGVAVPDGEGVNLIKHFVGELYSDYIRTGIAHSAASLGPN